MAKDFKVNATAGMENIYDELTRGNAIPAADVPAEKVERVRLNLLIPADIKDYLQARAYEQSNAKHTVSLTEYLCNLVRADMEKHSR